MKKLLPVLFFVGLLLFFLNTSYHPVHAQVVGTPNNSPTPAIGLPGGNPVPEGTWLIDSEVTFIGKNAARSRDLLNWTLQNYGWSETGGQRNPLEVFWSTIRNIVYGLLVFFILVTAFILIITRGKSISVRRFIPRFVGAVLLITFSFAVIEFLYVITDIFQGFFIRIRPNDPQITNVTINDTDLLYVGWDYQTFQGLRVFGDKFAESAFMSLLFTKLTALTYYAMVCILFVRKIILWFLIIVSPIFPILLLYYPTRNTGKIWLGEFFRWLLYAPLFAVFLRGLVDMWKAFIPLGFDFSQAGNPSSEVYPTGVNILLGGPGQYVTQFNNLNYVDTFAQYLIALIMLWIVIILPFILLQIFLDYMNKFNFAESTIWKQVQSGIQNFNKPPAIPPPPPGSPQPGGFGRTLPFGKKFEIPRTEHPTGMARQLPGATSIPAFQSAPKITERNQELMRLTNISVPTMRDIARFETTMLSRDRTSMQQVSQIKETLASIAAPASTSTVTDRQHYQALREKLIQQSRSGNVLATTVLTAANNVSATKETTNTVSQMQTILTQLAKPNTITSVTEREKITEIRNTLERESQKGNLLATNVLLSAKNISQVSATSKQSSEISRIQQTLTQLANPSQVTNEVEKQQVTRIREKLIAESQKGNTLATEILATNSTTSSEDIQKIREKLIEARSKGNLLAGEILSETEKTVEQKEAEKVSKELEKAKEQGNPLASILIAQLAKPQAIQAGTPTALPVANRVQSVSLDDYEAVKKMWQENYKNIEVPQSISGQKATRSAWIQDDMSKISETIDLLTSQDAQKVKQGMENVSNILPFLLIGGFSQTEIVAYLKAKQEAAKSVLEEVQKSEEEEETLVSRATKSETSRTQTASASREMRIESSAPSRVDVSITSDAPAHIRTATPSVTFTPGKMNIQILNQTNLTLPKMHDIVKYESQLLAKDEKKREEVSKIAQTLTFLAHPERASSQEKDKYLSLRDRLISESKAGDVLATAILSAAESSLALSHEKAEKLTPTQVQVLLTQIAKPSLVPSANERSQLTALQNTITTEKDKKNPLAVAVSDVLGKTQSKEDMENVRKQLVSEHLKGNPLAVQMLAAIEHEGVQKTAQPVALPLVNRVQAVSLDDYETVKKLWQENYKNLDVPQSAAGQNRTRRSWVEQDMKTIAETINLLTSQDAVKVKQGMKNVSNILPFLLIGGFSQTEIIAYLKAKQEAAKTVIEELSETDEESLVSVSTRKSTKEVPLQARSAVDSRHTTFSPVSSQEKQTVAYKETNLTMLSLVNLTLPKMKDIVTYEKNAFVSDNRKNTTLSKVSETLRNVANPSQITDAVERKRFETVHERLLQEARNGDPVSLAVLSAAGLQVTPVQKAPDELPTAQMQQALAALSSSADDETPKNVTELHEKLALESQRGNPLATQLLSQVNTYAASEVTAIEETLKKIGDPAKVSDPKERIAISELRDHLVSESKKGDSFASSMLTTANSLSQTVDTTDTIRSILLKLGNPRDVADSTTREKYQQFATRLEKESGAGNMLATELLRAAHESTPQQTVVNTHEVRQILAQAADPTDITMRNEREEYKKLNALLEKASKEGNQLATTVLRTTQETATADIEKTYKEILTNASDPAAIALREKIRPASSVSLSPQVISDIQTAAKRGEPIAVSFMSFIQTPSKEIEKLRKDLYAETKKGNLLAQAILRELRAPETSEIDKLKKALLDAKKANDPLALTLVAFMLQASEEATTKQGPASELPKTNRVQAVSLDDYETVKKMWHDNYLTMDVPQGADGGKVSREKWVQNDIEQISETINLLSSADLAKVREGMDHVSDILPFLLIGGFSQTEIVAYLKAKQEAGKMVLSELAAKEESEEKVSVKKKAPAAEKKEEAKLEDPIAPLEEKEKSDNLKKGDKKSG